MSDIYRWNVPLLSLISMYLFLGTCMEWERQDIPLLLNWVNGTEINKDKKKVLKIATFLLILTQKFVQSRTHNHRYNLQNISVRTTINYTYHELLVQWYFDRLGLLIYDSSSLITLNSLLGKIIDALGRNLLFLSRKVSLKRTDYTQTPINFVIDNCIF